MRSNSPNRRSNNSSVGNGISASSCSGVKSCLSGGRRMEKCTRSTAGSDFSRLRHTRAPGCGSPVISSTRNRSRTPLAANAARLLASVISCGPGLSFDDHHVAPAMRQAHVDAEFAVGAHAALRRAAGRRWSPHAHRRVARLRSITRPVMRIGSPTMPNVGADISSSRRSPRFGIADDRARAPGPSSRRRRGSAGGSAAWPSVTTIDAADAIARDIAERIFDHAR